MVDFLRDKKIAVIGMARTGMAVAEVAKELAAEVVLYDSKPELELIEAMAAARALGFEARPGTRDVELDGVDILVPSPGVPRNAPVFNQARQKGVEIVSEIELAYRISKAPIVAITGTNGKTTTTVLAGRMFEQSGRKTYVAGNVAAGDIKLPLVKAAYEAEESDVIVAEISTFQLEWITTFRPKIAALLNVTSDHMDRHASHEEYASLKARIFENQTAEDIACLNADNPYSASLCDKVSSKPVMFAKRKSDNVSAYPEGDSLFVETGDGPVEVCTTIDIALRGDHNIENILAAALMASLGGVSPAEIARGVRHFLPVEHRLEPVCVIDGVEYINNSMCTNVDAAVRSIEAIEEPQVIIAGGKDKGSDFGPLGEAFASHAKHVILIGEDARLLRAAGERAGFDRFSHARSMHEAVDMARERAASGDVVVLTPACASFDMFSSFEERGRAFKQAANDLLEEYGA